MISIFLTLAGLAEEMKYRGLHEADVVLAVGLPLAWVKTQAAEWRNYLMREKELDFSFRKGTIQSPFMRLGNLSARTCSSS